MTSYILFFVVGTAVVLILAVISRQVDQEKSPDQDIQLPPTAGNPTPEPISVDKSELDNQQRIKRILIGVAVAIMVAGIGVAVYLGKQSSGTTSASDDHNHIASFIPIWVAVFVPIFAAKNKKNSELSSKDNKRAIKILLLGLLMALFFGLFIFWKFTG